MESGGDREIRSSDRDVVATLHIHLAVAPLSDLHVERRYDEDLYEAALSNESRLQAGLRDSLSEHLGPEFDAQITVMTSRSVEVVASILLVGSLVASYNSLREGLMNARRDWKWLAERVLNASVGFPITVDAYLRPGPAIRVFPTSAAVSTTEPAALVRTQARPIPLPPWLVATGAVLLFSVFLGWLVVPLLRVANVL
jgi:hypothetical protein